MLQAVAELEAQVDLLTKEKASQHQTLHRLELEVARLKEGISKNRVNTAPGQLYRRYHAWSTPTPKPWFPAR